METVFTPFASTVGGVLIGLAAVLLMALRGRVFGATGVLAGFLHPASRSDWSWRALLLAGMVGGPALFRLFAGDWPTIDVPIGLPALLVGGFVVGVGVTFGSGWTSGHGVCGMARLSPRSFAATAVFMATPAITVFLVRHVIGGAV
jgi:uncharacterized membrane protein YedE/YeeE